MCSRSKASAWTGSYRWGKDNLRRAIVEYLAHYHGDGTTKVLAMCCSGDRLTRLMRTAECNGASGLAAC